MSHIFLYDTESTMNRHVFDFAYLLVKKSDFSIVDRGAFILRDFCKEKLFYNTESGFFGQKNLNIRTQKYRDMIKAGTRKLITVPELNARLAMIQANYKPVPCAYNIAFDKSLSKNSGIRVDLFSSPELDIMKESIKIFLARKGYWRFCLKNNLFSAKNYIKFSAESIGQYLMDKPDAIEPHTALEDLTDWEYLILCTVLRQKKKLREYKPLIWDDLLISSGYKVLHG